MGLNKRLFIPQAAAGAASTGNFAVKTYTPTSVSYNVDVGFNADLFITKQYSKSGNNWQVHDTIRGNESTLFLNLHDSTFDYSGHPNGDLALDFTSSGYTTSPVVNNGHGELNEDYVVYAFKGGGSAGKYNVDGTGYSTLSAAGLSGGTLAESKVLGISTNTQAGFSIIQYNASGASAGQTIETGLTDDIELIIIKETISPENWIVVDSITNKYQFLNLTNHGTSISFFSYVDGSKPKIYDYSTYVNYCFHSVDGYQRVGSYNGAGSSAKTVYTTDDGTSSGTGGFEPSFLLIKRHNSTGGNWIIYDQLRDGTNDRQLYANTNDDNSTTGDVITYNSNGFTIAASGSGVNALGSSYIYLAIA